MKRTTHPPGQPASEAPGSARDRRAGAFAHWSRRLVHVLLVATGWGLFLWLWSLVIDQPYDARALRLLVAICLVVVPVATLAWVLHNVGIHRRKGPRRKAANLGSNYRVDFKGRRIIADWKLLDRARHVEIGVAGDLKFYRFARAVGETEPRAQAGTGNAARSTRPAELSK